MELYEKTQRVTDLREAYMHSPMMTEKLSYTLDKRQLLLFMEGWEKGTSWSDPEHSCTTLLQRRSFAYAYVLEHMEPVILPGELIVGQPDFSALTEEENSQLAEAWKKRELILCEFGRTDHMSPSFETLLQKGTRGLREEIEEKLAALDLNKPADIEKYDFYVSALMELRGIENLQGRYAARARALAEASAGAQRQAYLELAAVLDRVPREPAETFREALQSIHFYSFCLWGLYQCGHPDRYLLPYYRRDIAEGRLTPAAAQELIDCFCMMYTVYIISCSSVGFMIGGRDENGSNVENELTWHFLQSIPHTDTADPSIGFCVNRDTSPEILRYAAALLAEGHSHPAIYNDDTIPSALQAYGVSEKDSHNYIHCCCVELTVHGKSSVWTVSPYHNVLSYLLEAMREHPDAGDMDALYGFFLEKLSEKIRRGALRENLWQLERSRSGGEPLLVSCLTEGCIETGRGIHQGGAAYNWIQPNFLGLANAVDSLTAVEQLVFRERAITLPELISLLDTDFAGNEPLRQRILKTVPHFGCGLEAPDALYRRLTDDILAACRNIGTYRGSFLMPAAFSYNEHIRHGLATGASPDGRHAGEPLADGSGPVQGRDTLGPTSLIRSCTAWEQKRYLGGIAVNLKLARNTEPAHIDALAALIRSFLQLGGIEIQVNALSTEELRDAQKHPENHSHLIVRVGGYSDYFTSLSPALQEEILSRTEQLL